MKRVVGFARDADHAPDFVPSPAKSGGRIRSFRGGTISCAKNRADKSNDRNFINGAWIQRYLNAVNVFGDGPSHLAKGTNAEGIMTWIDNYCAQHPGHSLTVAAKALVNELTEKATP